MKYKVNVLLSTYNGEKYIKEQLDSILKQNGVDVYLTIRDDGSEDSTLEIIEGYAKENSNIIVYKEKNIGWKKSFVTLLTHANMQCDYFAFADQDDIWLEEKLICAIKKIENQEVPALYQSKTILVDENLHRIQDYKIYEEPRNAQQALLNAWAQGCSMVFNKKACELSIRCIPNSNAAHDMWVYLICYFMGIIYFDIDNSYVLYRQHSTNATSGAADGHNVWGMKFIKKQIQLLVKHELYSNYARDIYMNYKDELKEEDKLILEKWSDYRENVRHKMELLVDKQVSKRTYKGTLALKLAILFSMF